MTRLRACARYFIEKGSTLLVLLASFSGHADTIEHAGKPITIIREGDGAGVKQDQELTKKEVQKKLTDARDKLAAENEKLRAASGQVPSSTDAQVKGNVASIEILDGGIASLGDRSPEQIKVISSVLVSNDLVIQGDKVTVGGGSASKSLTDASAQSPDLDLLDSQEAAIRQQAARKDKDVAAAVTAAAVTQSFVIPIEQEEAGIDKAASKEQDFKKTEEKVTAAAGSSSSSSSYDPEQGEFDTSSFAQKAMDALSLPESSSGSRDLSSSPLYKQASSPEIQSALRDAAFSGMDDAGENAAPSPTKLVNLATRPGFQDLVSSTLGPQAQRDFNLATAGAAISANSSLPPSGVALAKAYIYNNLSSAGMIQSSPLLSSLDGDLGGGGLAKLNPETLQWIALAGDLAFADPSKLPPDLIQRRELYRKGFEDFRAWLKVLQDSEGISLLDELRAPADPEKSQIGWKKSLGKFVQTHRRAKLSVAANKKSRSDGPEVVKQLDRLALWAQNLNDFDLGGVQTWGKVTTGKYRFPTLWNRFDPLTLKQSKFYYGQLVFYGSMPQFYSGSSKPMGILVGDAQKWSAKITQDQKLKRKSLASATRASAKK